MVADNNRRHGGEILQIERSNLLLPYLLAGFGIQTNQEIVGRFKEHTIMPDPNAAIANMRAAPRLPDVMPQLMSVARIERPGVVGGSDVERSVDHKYGAANIRCPVAWVKPIPPTMVFGARGFPATPVTTRLTQARDKFFTLLVSICVSGL